MSSGSRSKNIDSTSNNLSDKNDSDGKKGSASSNGKDKQYPTTAHYMAYGGVAKVKNGSRSSGNNSNKTHSKAAP
ncbi:hypothetical protein ACSQ67_020205 [Phaseolus vulgaris]